MPGSPNKGGGDDSVRVRVAVAGARSCATSKNFPLIDEVNPARNMTSGYVSCSAILVNLDIITTLYALALERRLKSKRLSGANQSIETLVFRKYH